MPLCTVITPVYNHWHLIPALLDKLAAQTLPQTDFEVILVDNGSEQINVPENLADNVRVLHCATPGSYAARNHAVEHATGEWLVFTDADCQPRPGWLEALLPTSGEEQKAARPLRAGAIQMTTDNPQPGPYEIYDLVKGIPQAWYVTRGYGATANLAVKADVLRALEGFDGTRFSGGDAEFCRRAIAAGHGIEYVPEAIVEHPARTEWPEIANKARRIKGGHLRAGNWRWRLQWTVRTLLPPVIAIARFARATQWPWRYRLTTMAVQLRLWGIEIAECINIWRRKPLHRT